MAFIACESSASLFRNVDRWALAAAAIVRSGGATAVQLDTTQVRIEKKKIVALILALGYEIWERPPRARRPQPELSIHTGWGHLGAALGQPGAALGQPGAATASVTRPDNTPVAYHNSFLRTPTKYKYIYMGKIYGM